MRSKRQTFPFLSKDNVIAHTKNCYCGNHHCVIFISHLSENVFSVTTLDYLQLLAVPRASNDIHRLNRVGVRFLERASVVQGRALGRGKHEEGTKWLSLAELLARSGVENVAYVRHRTLVVLPPNLVTI